MSEWTPPGSESDPPPYRGAPPSGPYDPYAAPAQPYATPPAYQPYPYGYGYGYAPQGYGPAHPREPRPGTLTAAAVLGYVTAGLLLLAGIILFTGASTVNDLNDNFDISNTYSSEFVTAGIVNLIAGGLLIGGAVAMTGRSSTGRALCTAGNGIVVALTVYWLTRWGTRTGAEGLIFWAFVFATLAVVGAALSFTSDGNRWLARRR